GQRHNHPYQCRPAQPQLFLDPAQIVMHFPGAALRKILIEPIFCSTDFAPDCAAALNSFLRNAEWKHPKTRSSSLRLYPCRVGHRVTNSALWSAGDQVRSFKARLTSAKRCNVPEVAQLLLSGNEAIQGSR